MAKKRNWQRKKKFRPQGGSTGGGGFATATLEEVRIDHDALPADLSEEELEELVSSLPPSTRKTKPKPLSYDELRGLTVADLHEVAKKEKIEDAASLRKRRDLVWQITSKRLAKHIPVRVSGLLDVGNDGHAFLRTAEQSYLASEEDVFVPPSHVQRFGLRTGMTVEAELRPAREGERYFAVKEILSIDDGKPEDVIGRTPFKELVPLYPDQRLILEGAGDNPLEMRIADLITPIGRGQRGLITAPPRTGKTVLLHQIARSIAENASDVHLIILLVDERPEEVTDFQRSLPEGSCEVISSTFDESSLSLIHI